MDKENAVYTYNGILFSLKKERNPSICNNMDKPGGHYVQWNKTSMREQTGYDFTYMQNQK